MPSHVFMYNPTSFRVPCEKVDLNDGHRVYSAIDETFVTPPAYATENLEYVPRSNNDRGDSGDSDESDDSDDSDESDESDGFLVNSRNFARIVKRINLDQNSFYHGQTMCFLCNQGFNVNPDVRILACMHCFHGNCIYFYIIQSRNLTCPICNTRVIS